MLIEKVRRTIQKFNLIPKGSKVVVAISGGPDSIVLTYILKEFLSELNIELLAAHFNHKLRGMESERDEDFVRQTCLMWNIPLVVGSGDIGSISKGKNVESVARRERYRFLHGVLKDRKFDLIAVAHTASDLLETVIFNLVKGSGIKGLRGFLPKNGRIVRPLFEIKRSEIVAFTKSRGLSFVVDSSNLSLGYQRNIIRHKVVPVLKTINPNLEESVLRESQTIRDVESLLNTEADSYAYLWNQSNGMYCTYLENLRGFPVALRKLIILRFFERTFNKTLNFKNVSDIEAAIFKSGYRILDLGEGIEALKDQKMLCFRTKSNFKPFEFEIKKIPSSVKLPNGTLEFSDEPCQGDDMLLVPYSYLKRGLTVRSRQPGDFIRFNGFTRKLKKFFIDKKVSKNIRDRIPLLVSQNEVLWIIGMKRAHISPSDRNICVRFIDEGSH